jgi:SAM-dependent methyltransferase
VSNDQKLSVKDEPVNRFDGLFYSKSDEKFTVRTLLEEIFGDRSFERSLDVGPGAGHVSEPLVKRSKAVTMIESAAEFQPILKQRFEKANVIVSRLADVELTEKFDVILFSHVLYYQPCDQWLDCVKRLQALLKPGGELLIILNADSGDWWKIISRYRADLGKYFGFNYIALSTFRKELAALGAVKVHPYRYQMWIDQADWSEFIGHQMLELTDETVMREHEAAFAEFGKMFKIMDNNFVLDMRAEIIRLAARA